MLSFGGLSLATDFLSHQTIVLDTYPNKEKKKKKQVDIMLVDATFRKEVAQLTVDSNLDLLKYP